MGDMGEFFRDWDEDKKRRRLKHYADFQKIRDELSAIGLKEHTPYHYSIRLGTYKVDYWPSTNKWAFRDRTYTGNPEHFRNWLKKRMSP